jgi:anti-sigma regulatory factor (Ser/Thr protein kinase)
MNDAPLPVFEFDPQDLLLKVDETISARVDHISPVVDRVMGVIEGLLLVVRDPGVGFDPDAIPSPVQGQEVFRGHGRGIFLINELMDEVSFERGGTEIRMRKR